MNKTIISLISTALLFGASVVSAEPSKKKDESANLVASSQESQVVVSDAFAKASLAGSKKSAMFMSIKNNTDSNLTIVDVSATEVANSSEIHSTVTDANGTMKMEKASSLSVNSGEVVEFKSGGNHVMLINLKKELKEGDSFKASVVFKEIGAVEFDVVVKN